MAVRGGQPTNRPDERAQESRYDRKPAAPPEIPEHVIWRLAKNGRLAEARMRFVLDRPEIRIYVQHPTPEFQLLWSLVTTDNELDTLARQQRQLFEAKG